MRGRWVAVLIGVQALLWPAGLMADAGTQYPASHLKISVSPRARANSIVTVTFSGTNAVFTQGAPITYQLDAFVQARSALPTCPASYDAEFNNYANLAGRSIVKIATNLNEGVSGPFRFSVKYRSGTTRRIVICAYSRLITDDAAHAQLRRTLRR